MGETGVGKTSLVNYFANIIDAVFTRLFLHAGTEEKAIVAFVNETIEKAKE